jgi:dUTP pyrophosphatase
LTLKIKKLAPNAVIPSYAHGPDEDAGFDLRAIQPAILKPLVPTLVKTGLSIALPPGFEAQIRPRSGLALKHGITVLNSPGTVDPGYRGEIGVILLWTGVNRGPGAEIIINEGDRIAQMVVARYEPIEFAVEEELAETARGAGGFGSSGLQ